jgi:tetratricopeptide (TPR) repeat protein
MSNTPALSRKDMREPDRFQNVANQAAAWMAARKKLIALVGGAAVLLLIVLGVIVSIQGTHEEKAGLAVSNLLALTKTAVADAPINPNEKVFKTEEEKQKALLAEADKIVKDFGVDKTTVMAVLTQANAHYGLKEWDAAAQSYEQYVKEASPEDSFRPLALENIGLSLEAKGDLAGAAAAYERMAKDAPAYGDRADLDRVRVLAAAGKSAEAKAILDKFPENHKDSLLSAQAATQAMKMGAK